MNISTHAPRVRRDEQTAEGAERTAISTHAPRVRRDVDHVAEEIRRMDFYSRASCEARQ